VNRAALPEAVDLYPDRLRLQWADGVSELPAADLRAACRCGSCRAAFLQGEPHRPDAGIRLTGAEPVGQYALQLFFSDGHDRGIYPWSLLRELAPLESTPTPTLRQV
jgi:DUF971 family protein